MKNKYIHLIIFFLAAISCSKKSDSPQPAPVAQQPKESKIAAPETRPETKLGSGTVRETPVDITVTAGTQVTVAGPNQMRGNMGSDAEGNLNKLTGAGANLRTENALENKYFGWFVHDLNINGEIHSGFDEMKRLNFAKVYFFNIDEPGIYYIHDYIKTEWSWGTWAVDSAMNYVAFNVEPNGIYNNLWSISDMTEDRIVLSIQKDFDGDGDIDNIAIGLNGYDLKNDNNNGQVVLSDTEKNFIGSWYYVEILDPNNQPLVGWSNTDVVINADGQALTRTYTLNGNDDIYSNWTMEEISGSPGYAYVVTTYYENGFFYYDKYVTYIQNTYMYFILDESSNPDNADAYGYTFKMAKK